MRQPIVKGLTFIVVLVFASAAWTQDERENGISSHETKNHIGEFAMVCGVVVAVRRERNPYSTAGGSGYPLNYSLSDEHTALYFDKLPPHHEFFVYIKDQYRKELPVEPESFVDRKACVYGKIAKDNGRRQVIALVRTFQIAVGGIALASK